MRNNPERLGASLENQDISPVPVLQEATGDFSFIEANDIVELPSKGVHYPEGHILRANPAIELKPMTAKQEDILVNQAYIKQGTVVDRLLESIVVDKNLNLDDLLVGDKNALLIQARVSAYGKEYPVSSFCRHCYEKQEITYDLEECVIYKEATYEDGIESNEDGTFTIQMPKSKLSVTLRFLTSADEKVLAAKKKKYEKYDMEFSDQLEGFRQMIVAVNGDDKLISKYLDHMPLQDSKYLKKIIKAVPPNAQMIGNFECKSCDMENEVEVPVTFRFFWPDI